MAGLIYLAMEHYSGLISERSGDSKVKETAIERSDSDSDMFM
jgi:hypothetical protein